MRVLVLCLLAVVPAPVFAQTAAESLPVRRVILYKTGVGFFEHRGRVTGSQDVTVRFTSGQLNDVLKSLTAIDLGSGRVTGISYGSAAPLDRRLEALRLPVGRNATLIDMLGALRGARVELTTGGAAVSGRLLSVGRMTRPVGANSASLDVVSILTDSGELRTHEVDPALRIRIAERDLQQDIGQYLDLVGSARDQDVRRMVIRTSGSGERELFVTYVSEAPVWKTTYRLVLPEAGAPFLQGWAIVDNTTGEDWTGVQLSLVAGAPQTFVQAISQPFYSRRPVVPLPHTAVLTPQTHASTLETGPGTLVGAVRDGSGSALPGVRVLLHDGARRVTAITDARGEYRVAVPAGVYRVEFQLPGFSPALVDGVALGGAMTRQQDATLTVGGGQEHLTMAAQAPAMARADRGVAGRVGGGVVGGVVGGLPEAPLPPAAPAAGPLPSPQPAAAAAELGDLFEYRIKEPVTIAKNESSLVPILTAEVAVEKVSLWTRAASGRPLRAIWITNTSDLTLDGGSFSVVEGDAFAGEGLMAPLEPGERRLLSYAADLGVLVQAESASSASRIVRLRARNGVVIQDTEERSTTIYRIRNEDGDPRVVVVEHPVRPGWQLAGGSDPAERSPVAYRFKVAVEARREVTLEVAERRAVESSLALGELDDTRFNIWVGAGFAAADLERALKPLIEQRRVLDVVEGRIAQLESERQSMFQDQQRLRENLAALGGSREERQLRERYTRGLDQQESRLEALQRDLAAAIRDRDTARRELARLIGDTALDVTAQ